MKNNIATQSIPQPQNIANQTPVVDNGLQIIGKDEIRKATETLNKYKQGKASLDNRIIKNQEWWRMRHWEMIASKDNKSIKPASAWLFNSIANKHADAMDNYPEPSVLPRSKDDEVSAKRLSSILPVIIEQNEYEQVYSDSWWYKLIQGTVVKGIFWNNNKLNGLGDIDIRQIDLLNLVWQPGKKDIQQSMNVFNLELVDNDVLKQKYPDINVGGRTIEIPKYINDENIDTSDKSVVVDWYYKKNKKLHYCKFVGDNVLYASENDPDYTDRGFYDHGKYPFVFDTLFMTEDSPCGFGYVDVMKDCQEYIDKLNQAIVENALLTAKKRFFVREDGNVNEAEYSDFTKTFVHISGQLDDNSIREINLDPLSSVTVNVLQNKIEELKETSGNRDFSQGSTSSGVTAASAIAALIETGSKLSRDMIKSAYRSFKAECDFVIELIRQFYDEPRSFRITGENSNGYQFEQFDNTQIKPQKQGIAFGSDMGERLPIFDLNVIAAKKSTYSRMSQNELALQFYGLGFFNPQQADQTLSCLDMMDFDGKEKIIEKVQQNGTMLQLIQQMQAQMQQMATIIATDHGLNPSVQTDASKQGSQPSQQPSIQHGGNSLTQQAQSNANNATAPR